jgi:hypothetical protein
VLLLWKASQKVKGLREQSATLLDSCGGAERGQETLEPQAAEYDSLICSSGSEPQGQGGGGVGCWGESKTIRHVVPESLVKCMNYCGKIAKND